MANILRLVRGWGWGGSKGWGEWRTSLFREEKKRERTLKPAAVLSASSSSLIQIFLNSLCYNSEISSPPKKEGKKDVPCDSLLKWQSAAGASAAPLSASSRRRRWRKRMIRLLLKLAGIIRSHKSPDCGFNSPTLTERGSC